MVFACSNAASRSNPNDTATVKFDCFALSSTKKEITISSVGHSVNTSESQITMTNQHLIFLVLEMQSEN